METLPPPPPGRKKESSPKALQPPEDPDLIPFADDEAPRRPPPRISPPISARSTQTKGSPPPAPRRSQSSPPPAVVQVDYARKAMHAGQPKPGARPGVVTTLGVLSIVFGSLGILGNIVAVVLIRMVFAQANPPVKAALRPQSSAPRVAVTPYDGDRKGTAGLGRDARFAVVSAVHAAAPLSGDRQVMLDNLLGEWGSRLFPGATPTSESARQAMLEVGQLPAGPDGLRTAGSHYFRTAGGAVLIDDARARYIPASGGNELRIDGNVILSGEWGVRCNAWIARELDRLRTSLGNSFSATQAAALGQWLAEQRLRRHDDERIFYSRSAGTVWESKARMKGTTLEYASIQILPEGRIIDLTSVEQQQASMMMPAAKPVSGPKLDPSTGRMVESLSAVEVAISGFLLACGIGIFLQWRRAAMAHRWYVWVKFAIIAIGIILTHRFLTELESTPVALGNKAAAARTEAISRASIFGGFIGEMLYPIAILFMLRSKSARDYFAALAGNVAISSSSSGRGALMARLDHPKGKIVAASMAGITIVAGLAYWVFAGGPGAGEGTNCPWLIACAATAAIWITAALWPAKAREA